MSIRLKKNGMSRNVSTGFSFKSLFFGCFYPMAVGDWRGVAIQWGLSILTVGFSWFFVPFFYNGIKIRRMIENGFEPANDKAERYLVRKYNYIR